MGRKPYECPEGCPDRRVGCHGTCEIYAEYRRVHEAILAAKAAEREAECAHYHSKKHLASERSYIDRAKRGYNFK